MKSWVPKGKCGSKINYILKVSGDTRLILPSLEKVFLLYVQMEIWISNFCLLISARWVRTCAGL